MVTRCLARWFVIRTGILFTVSICKGGIICVGEIIGIVSINYLLMLRSAHTEGTLSMF